MCSTTWIGLITIKSRARGGPASIQTTRFHLLKILETQVQRQRQKGHLRLPARGAAEARAGEITPARGHVGVTLCSHTPFWVGSFTGEHMSKHESTLHEITVSIIAQ